MIGNRQCIGKTGNGHWMGGLGDGILCWKGVNWVLGNRVNLGGLGDRQ